MGLIRGSRSIREMSGRSDESMHGVRLGRILNQMFPGDLDVRPGQLDMALWQGGRPALSAILGGVRQKQQTRLEEDRLRAMMSDRAAQRSADAGRNIMQDVTSRRGQDYQADTGSRQDETRRRGQDLALESGREGRAATERQSAEGRKASLEQTRMKTQSQERIAAERVQRKQAGPYEGNPWQAFYDPKATGKEIDAALKSGDPLIDKLNSVIQASTLAPNDKTTIFNGSILKLRSEPWTRPNDFVTNVEAIIKEKEEKVRQANEPGMMSGGLAYMADKMQNDPRWRGRMTREASLASASPVQLARILEELREAD